MGSVAIGNGGGARRFRSHRNRNNISVRNINKMCWSFEISLAAAGWGYAVSAYLKWRKYSVRDGWYALFLATFTTTQLFDAFFWYIKQDQEQIPCTPSNLVLSKYFLPAVVFFQPIVLSLFPEGGCKCIRWLYRLGTGGGCAVAVIFCGCSLIQILDTPTPYDLPQILWGGLYPPAWIIYVGCAFWALGAVLFVRPWRAALAILLVGTVVLTLLTFVDGSVRLLSKMCTYCLILSFVWLAEPLWNPPAVNSTATALSPDLEMAGPNRTHNQKHYAPVFLA